MTMMLAPTTSPAAAHPMVVRSDSFMPALSIQQGIDRRNAVVQYVQKCLVKEHDYGSVGGMDRPTLLKPGAEKLNTLFGLTPRYELVEKVEDWTGEHHGGAPFFYYWFRCQLWRGDVLIAEQDGSCNSHEKKYRWRWVAEHDVPQHLDKTRLVRRASVVREPKFAISKRETGGRFGKPAAYWDRFERAITDKTARPAKWSIRDGKQMEGWELDDVLYRVPNEDVAEQVNTILKMAQKRALIASTLVAVNASEFFTQDVEDLDMIEGDWRPGPAAPPPGNMDHATGEVVDEGPSRDEQFLTKWDALVDEKKLHKDIGRNVLATMFRKRKLALPAATDEQREELLESLRKATPADIDKIRKLAEKPKDGNGETEAAAPVQQTDTARPQQQQATPVNPVTPEEVKGDYLDWFEQMVLAGVERGKDASQTLHAVQRAARLLQKAPEDMTDVKRAGLLNAARAGALDYETGKVIKPEDTKL